MATTLEILRNQQLYYINVRDQFKSEVLTSFKLIMIKFEETFKDNKDIKIIVTSKGKGGTAFFVTVDGRVITDGTLFFSDYKFMSNKEQKRFSALTRFLVQFFLYLPTEGKENIDIIEFYNSIKGE